MCIRDSSHIEQHSKKPDEVRDKIIKLMGDQPRVELDVYKRQVCFHPRYALGDHHNYIDKDDFLREMYLNTVGNNERGTERYERMVNMVWSRKMTGDHPDPRAVDDAMLRVISEKYVVMPLYLLDHSVLSMQTESCLLYTSRCV